MAKKKTKKKLEFEDVEIVRHDAHTIILPEPLSLLDAAVWCRRMHDQAEEPVSLYYQVFGHPLDAAVQWNRALKEQFGFYTHDGTNVDVPVAHDTTVRVPWGEFKVPGIDGVIVFDLEWQKDMPNLVIGGRVKRKHEPLVAVAVNRTRELIATQSIYRGKAVRMSFPDSDDVVSMDDYAPTFLDLTDVKPDELVFSQSVNDLIAVNLFTPIEHTAAVRDAGVPLKRGVLLAGDYGVGKTMASNVAAKKCEANGWTFIYLTDVRRLQRAIGYAQKQQPCVIFAEDIDQVLSGEARDRAVNDMLNAIDGVDSKHSEVMVVLTTNHVDKVNQAMLRPGRLDAVITVKAPDAAAAIRLARQYGRDLIADTTDLTDVGVLLDGQKPAVIRECVERAKLTAQMRKIRNGSTEPLEVTADDLVTSIHTMTEQLNLLRPKPVDTRSNVEKAAATLADAIQPRPTNGGTQPRRLHP